MSKKRLDLSGMPNLDAMLSEALRQGLRVQYARRTGEVQIWASWGHVTCNARKKGGNMALRAILREGQRREDHPDEG